MSDSLMPDKQPNWLRQENLDKALELLRQPFSIAVLASLGVHGLLWVALPLLPSAKPQEFDARQTVGVVELSPTEQLQLPDFANPQVSFPPLTSQTKLPKVPSKTSKAKKTPEFPSLFDNSSLYNFPLFPPPPVLNIPIFDPPPIQGDRLRTRVITGPKVQPTKPKPVPAEPPATGGAPPTSSPDPKAAARKEKLTTEQLAALLDQGKKNLTTRELFTFNAANTKTEDFTKNAGTFSLTAQQISQGNLQDGKDGWNKQKDVTDLYPKEACSLKVKGKPIVGNTAVAAIVQPDGKLAALPTILQSSGYPGLDNIAVDYVSKQKFDSGEKYRVMLFPFIFKPSEKVCSASDSEKPAKTPDKPAKTPDKPAS